MKKNILKKVVLVAITALLFSFPFQINSAQAAMERDCPLAYHKLEVKLPGFPDCVGGPGGYIIPLFQLALGIGVFLAAILMGFGALKYGSARDNAAQKKDGLDQFGQALLGLLLLFAVTLILRTINPKMADLGYLQEISASKFSTLVKCKPLRDKLVACLNDCQYKCQRLEANPTLSDFDKALYQHAIATGQINMKEACNNWCLNDQTVVTNAGVNLIVITFGQESAKIKTCSDEYREHAQCQGRSGEE